MLHAVALPLAPSPGAWVGVAMTDLDAVMRDHVHCERKAAQSALSLLRAYPDHAELVVAMARLAHEETRHVIQVNQALATRGHAPGPDLGDEYAAGLQRLVRRPEPARLLDRLLVFAIIEGRSAERLQLLAEALAQAPSAAFPEGQGARTAALYAQLADAEVRHRDLFVRLAATVSPEWQTRMHTLCALEAQLMAQQPLRPRIH